MRSIAKHGLMAFGLAALMACSHENEKLANTPQQAVTHPTPQTSNDPIAQNGWVKEQQTPMQTPGPQDPTLGTAGPQQPAFSAGNSQQPISDPSVQKPFGSSDTDSNKMLAKTERPLSDAEIIGVVMAVNDGEVQMADQATKKATDKDVRSFAVMMKTMHTQGLAKTKATSTKTKITPQDSDVSSFLKSDVAKTTADLRDRSGHDFDTHYIDAQVLAHKNALAAIDNRLMPGAENSEVKSLLTETRKVVVDHIQRAEEVQKKVENGVSMTNSDSSDKSGMGMDNKSSSSSKAKGIEPRP